MSPRGFGVLWWPTPAHHPALLGDMCGVELHHLPPGRPPIVGHRPVIVTSGFHTYHDLQDDEPGPARATVAATRPERVIANSTGPINR